MKFCRFKLQSVVGDAESAPRFARLQVEENRYVGKKPVDCGGVDFLYKIRTQSARITLIRNGAVNVPVAHHKFASFKRRLDDFDDA